MRGMPLRGMRSAIATGGPPQRSPTCLPLTPRPFLHGRDAKFSARLLMEQADKYIT